MKRNQKAAQAATRQTLLEAAGAVFAERGYRSTTIRRICQQAGANVAAVNYHFGNKGRLYLDVIRQAHSRALAKYPFDLGLGPTATPEARLHAFVRSFLLRIFDTSANAWVGKLMVMEMLHPTAALDSLVRERIRPMADTLGSIVRVLLGPKANPERVRLCGFSVVSQCLFYAHGRSVVTKLYPDLKLGLKQADRLADHITRFSLAALKPGARLVIPKRRGKEARRTTAIQTPKGSAS